MEIENNQESDNDEEIKNPICTLRCKKCPCIKKDIKVDNCLCMRLVIWIIGCGFITSIFVVIGISMVKMESQK